MKRLSGIGFLIIAPGIIPRAAWFDFTKNALAKLRQASIELEAPADKLKVNGKGLAVVDVVVVDVDDVVVVEVLDVLVELVEDVLVDDVLLVDVEEVEDVEEDDVDVVVGQPTTSPQVSFLVLSTI